MNSNLVSHSRTRQQIEGFLLSPSHAVALNGEIGAGKGHTAEYICAQLLQADIKNHPYVKKLDTQATKAGIDEVRELQKFLTLTVPGKQAIKRALIIEYIDNLGHEAQNALLKTLEEPPADTVIVVTYTRSTAILPTIHSRLQTISVLPISQTDAQNSFVNYTDKAFLISGGQAGLLWALLENKDEHPLIRAINQARSIIGMSRYQRLASVDTLLKDKDTPPTLLLDGLYRLLDASYRQSVKSKSNSDLQPMASRLKFVEEAVNDLDQNIQAKLVMSRLFMVL